MINTGQSSRNFDLTWSNFWNIVYLKRTFSMSALFTWVITLLPWKWHILSQTGKRHVFSKVSFPNYLFWISGKKEWDNVTSLMKLRDINFAARNEVKSYDGPFLSRDFLEYIKNITTVFLISFSTISYSFISRNWLSYIRLYHFSRVWKVYFSQILSYVCPCVS